jgi:hypothetical protein
MSPVECGSHWASGCLRDLSDELHALGALCCADTEITASHIADGLSVLSLRVLSYSRFAELLERADQAQATMAEECKEATQ